MVESLSSSIYPPEESRKTRRIEVANRLPVKLVLTDDGTIAIQRTIGGMATAIDQANKEVQTDGSHPEVILIGWPEQPKNIDGICEQEREKLFRNNAKGQTHEMIPVWLTEQEIEGYYEAIANRSIWPHQHKHGSRADYSPEEFPGAWERFVEANTKFAETILTVAENGDQLRIHDYHLPLVAQVLKEREFKGKISSFQHIPFASPKEFQKMPHWKEILDGLLKFDFIGFQTIDDRNNFAASVRHTYPNAEICATKDRHLLIKKEDETTKVSAIPISINPEQYKETARKPEVSQMAENLRTRHGDRKLVFLAGRRDYKNGFVESLIAYYIALTNNPDIRERLTYLLAAPESRETIPAYQKYGLQLTRWANTINNKFGNESWQPVVVYEKGLNAEEMVAHSKASDAIIVGSRKDGLNLVAKEGVAVARNDCIMMISTGAGVAKEFHQALLFDPTNIREQARLIPELVSMPYGKRQRRMQELKIALKNNQINDWDQKFWQAAKSLEEPNC